MLNNSDMPAAPVFRADGFMAKGNDGEKYRGLTKREAFAMAAMQELVSHEYGYRQLPEDTATRAVELAIALLEELSK